MKGIEPELWKKREEKLATRCAKRTESGAAELCPRLRCQQERER
jgi:hypothetical protein